MPREKETVAFARQIVSRAGCAVEKPVAAGVVKGLPCKKEERQEIGIEIMGRARTLLLDKTVPDVTLLGNEKCCDWDTYFCPFFPHVEMCFTHNPEAQSSRSPTKPSLPGMAFFMRTFLTLTPRIYLRGSD